MIDHHMHLRDWSQSYKETVKHALYVAWAAGLDAVFEMPNTDPALTSKGTIKDRFDLADRAIEELKQEYSDFEIFHGLYAGITSSPKQILEVVEAYRENPRVVGLKLFAGQSTGDMGIINENDQRAVYMNLARFDYEGVLYVHCEKEDFIKKTEDGKQDWDPSNPYTHSLARPPEAEIESVKDQIKFASDARFKGILNIVEMH